MTAEKEIWSKVLISHYTHHICLNNKRIHGGVSLCFLMGDSKTGRRVGGEISVDLSCQTSAPMEARGKAFSNFHWRAEPISGRKALEVQPPDFNRLKCKPVSSAVRKQIENFVPLVSYRTGRFPWTRIWTVDTLDAEQDPRRRHKPDTVFFVCGFNTMGESKSWIVFSSSSCQGCSCEHFNGQGGESLARYRPCEMFWRLRFIADPVGRDRQPELFHVSVTHEFWSWPLNIRAKFTQWARQLSVSYVLVL